MTTRSVLISVAIVGLSAAVFIPGLPWGLPSNERANIVLPEKERTPEFFSEIARARQAIYEHSGGNPNAEIGKKLEHGLPLYPPSFAVPHHLMLLSYSSFLVRSMDPDEQRTLAALAQMRPHRLKFNPHYFIYGGLYIYGLGAWLALCRAAHLIFLVPDVSYYYQHPEAMRAIYVAGRSFTVFMGIGALLAFFGLVRRYYDEWTASFAVVLAALTPVVIAQGHLMKPHLPGCVASLGCLAASLEIVSVGPGSAFWPYLLAGLCGGAAMSFNPFYASFCGLAIIFAHGFASTHFHQEEGSIRRIIIRWGDLRFWKALIAMSVVYLLTNPYAILAFHEYRLEMVGYQLGAHRIAGLLAAWNFWHYPLRDGLGDILWFWQWPACFFVAIWGRKEDRFLLLLFLFFGLYCGMQIGEGSSAPEVARYFLPGIFVMVLLCVRAWIVLGAKLRVRWLASIGMAFLIAATLPIALETERSFIKESSGRTPGLMAGRWIENNIPVGSDIGIISPMPHIYSEPPFPFGHYHLFSLGALADLDFRPNHALPTYAVWGAYYGTFPRAAPNPYEGYLLKLGYRRWLSFKVHGSRNGLLTTASMPFFIYKR